MTEVKYQGLFTPWIEYESWVSTKQSAQRVWKEGRIRGHISLDRIGVTSLKFNSQLDKVPRGWGRGVGLGGTYPRTSATAFFKKGQVCSFEFRDGTVLWYITRY